MSNIKSINGLMKYLRKKHNIQIDGSRHKKQLKSIGYYHGYKGYRYIKKPKNKINFMGNQVLKRTLLSYEKKTAA